MGQHKDLGLANLHSIHAWAWVNAAAKTAQTVAASDLGKVGWKQDDNTFWVLTDDSPVTWTQLQGGAGSGVPAGGTTGQVLTKNSAVDGDAGWATPSGGGGSSALVLAQFGCTAGTACGAGAITKINFDQLITDSNAAVTTGAGWKFTCPVGRDGVYTVKGALFLPTNGIGNLILYKNNALLRWLATAPAGSGGTNNVNVPFDTDVVLAAGDYIDVRLETAGALTTRVESWISITSATIAAASIGARATCTTAQALNVGSFTIVPFNNEVWDSNNAFTTGVGAKFTAPVTGKYLISTALGTNAAGGGGVYILKNGDTANNILLQYGSGFQYGGNATIIHLAAGDYVQVATHNSVTRSLDGYAQNNWVSIVYLGA